VSVAVGESDTMHCGTGGVDVALATPATVSELAPMARVRAMDLNMIFLSFVVGGRKEKLRSTAPYRESCLELTVSLQATWLMA